MDRNIRLLWAYDHPTARYQEVNFYIDAGMEVIVSLGDPATLRFDRDYHDETHALYPDWRSSVTLPASIVEGLRRVSLTQFEGIVSSAAADLVNRYIDVMIVAADAPTIANIMTWYRGHLLYRVMGGPDQSLMTRNLESIEKIAADVNGRLWLAPGLKGVVPFADPTLSSHIVYLNCWVSPERLQFEWLGEQSRPTAVSAISYIDFHPFFADQFDNLKKKLRSTPFVVVGKNDRRSDKCSDPRILGALSTTELHHTLASSRVFVDAATVPEHLVWPPLEAMAMGVPVLFTRWSALAAAGLDEGQSEETLRDAGMFADFEAIDLFLRDHLDDLDALRKLAANQRTIFLEEAFSREKAMSNLRPFLDLVRQHRTRNVDAAVDESLRVEAEQARRRGITVRARASLARLEGSDLLRSGRLIRPSEFKGDTGKLIRMANGHLARRVVQGEAQPGNVAIDTLPSLPQGTYRLKAALVVEEGRGVLGVLAVGAHTMTGYIENATSVLARGAGYQEVEVTFTVNRDTVGAQREVCLRWDGSGAIVLEWLQIARGIESAG